MQLGDKMYSQDQYFVLLRECMQNSLDAGATKVTIKTDFDEWISIEDDGCGMTKEQLLSTFLTVGGSNKLRNVETVGGFGIAKLAIFSCNDFEVISSGNRLTKEILVNHLQLQPVECVPGTFVRLEKKDLFPYNSQNEVNWFLQSIDRNVEIILNGELVKFCPKTQFNASDVLLETGIEPWAVHAPKGEGYHCVMVRANGLPVFKSLIYEKTSMAQRMAFIYEVNTDLEPYDPLYPFTITRDQFNAESEDKKRFEKFKSALAAHFRNIQLMEEATKEALMYDEAAGIWTMFNPTISAQTLALVKAYEKCIRLLFMLNGVSHEKVEYGLIGESALTKMGSYTDKPKEGYDVFFINEMVKTPERILTIAIHEFTHRSNHEHYESFANAMTMNVEKVFVYLGMNYNNSILGLAENVMTVREVKPADALDLSIARFDAMSIFKPGDISPLGITGATAL
jgi:hypothetical protein